MRYSKVFQIINFNSKVFQKNLDSPSYLKLYIKVPKLSITFNLIFDLSYFTASAPTLKFVIGLKVNKKKKDVLDIL